MANQARKRAPCPCGSGPSLDACCGPVLDGRAAATPEQLMRSRYTAYATGDVDHVVRTTDPSGPNYRLDVEAWRDELVAFCRTTRFLGLEVEDGAVDAERGWVRFRVRLSAGGRDASFRERSTFVLRGGRWLYHAGVHEQSA